MFHWLRKAAGRLAWAGMGVLTLAGAANAQNPTADIDARIEAGNRELQELKALLQERGVQPAGNPAALDDAAVKKIVEGYLAEKSEKKKADSDAARQRVEDEGYKVGTALNMEMRWDPKAGGGFTAETPNKDFTLHIGGHMQWDNNSFTQSPQLKAPAQFGDLQDGTFFRRARIQFDGTFWENYEYNLNYSLERVNEGIPNLSEFYVGYRDIPYLGTVRVGQVRLPQGLEGDTSASSRATTFMEVSASTEAFNERFGTGVWVGNHVLDDRATWTTMFYRQPLALHDPVGADFGDGKYAATGRLTFLPVYENDGACLVHLGVSGTWRKAENADPGFAGPGVVRLRARPELRDATGDFGTGTLPGNASRLIDTGTFAADSTGVFGAELFVIRGPFSAMAEWTYAVANDATAGTGTAASHQDRSFNGGYVQVAYYLTGEHRTYERRTGRLASSYLEGPNTNFWFTRGEDGRLLLGRGAWEIAARYSYVNLNDGPVQGGVLSGYTVGLNWFLSPNLRLDFNYVDENRYHAKSGILAGSVQGLGVRAEIAF